MDTFELALRRKFDNNLGNNFLDNYDELRFGKEKINFKEKLKRRFLKNYTSHVFIRSSVKKLDSFLSMHGKSATDCYNLLANNQSKNLYLDLICFRLLGGRKVKIMDTSDFLERRANQNYDRNTSTSIKLNFNKNSWTLEEFVISYSGRELKLFSRPAAIFTEFSAEQYTYSYSDTVIGVSQGDFCIDAGACWGDSTTYFSLRAGREGRVVAFEFIPGNIKILEKNLSLNTEVTSNVCVVQRPLWSEPGLPVWYKDKGPASKVFFDKIDDADGSVMTYTIDKLVEDKNLERLDFIKMDIEGAESNALLGAKNSIMRFKPKLAICIYHNWEDFTSIASWINELKLGYKFYLKHATVHAEETVLFAI